MMFLVFTLGLFSIIAAGISLLFVLFCLLEQPEDLIKSLAILLGCVVLTYACWNVDFYEKLYVYKYKNHIIHEINGADFYVCGYSVGRPILVNANAEFNQDFKDGEEIRIKTTNYSMGVWHWSGTELVEKAEEISEKI